MFRIIFLFSMAFSPIIQTKPLLSLNCLLLNGVVSNELKTWDKPAGVKPVDLQQQKKTLSNLKKVASISPRFPNSQCFHSCASYAHAQYLNLLAPGLFSESISGGYITARVLEKKFRDFLSDGKSISLGTNFSKVEEAVVAHGIMTDSQYPSRPNINTDSLAKALEKTGRLYRAQLSKYRHNAKKTKAIEQEALDLASTLVQFYFGKYPSPIYLKGKKVLPQEQFRMIHHFAKVSSGRDYFIENHMQLGKISDLLISNGLPIILGYEHHGTHAGDGFFHTAGETDDKLGHAVVLTSVYHDNSGTIYYGVSNSHVSANRFFLSEQYLREHMIIARFVVPPKLQGLVEDALAE